MSDRAISRLFNRQFLVRTIFGSLLASILVLLDTLLSIRIAEALGVYLTLAILASTGLIGAFVILVALFRMIQRLRSGIGSPRSRRHEITGGLGLLFAGVFVLLPGLASDALFCLFWLTPLGSVLGSLVLSGVGIGVDRAYEIARLDD